MAEATTTNPVGVDPTRASVARVYDALLGGKDNYEIDRQVAQQVENAGGGGQIARDSRAWLGRLTRYLASTVGIDQFIDCGSGLPTAENTHQIASRMNRDARTVYVDNDPVVLAHGRALLADNENSFFIEADLGKPDEVLQNESVVKNIDFERPILLLQVCTLHHLPDGYDPDAIMRHYIDALPSGSYVALNHMFNPGDGSDLEQLALSVTRAAQESAAKTGRLRDLAEIKSLFGPCELIEPGVVAPAEWWPDGPPPENLADERRLIIGGLARKP